MRADKELNRHKGSVTIMNMLLHLVPCSNFGKKHRVFSLIQATTVLVRSHWHLQVPKIKGQISGRGEEVAGGSPWKQMSVEWGKWLKTQHWFNITGWFHRDVETQNNFKGKKLPPLLLVVLKEKNKLTRVFTRQVIGIRQKDNRSQIKSI